ncbi:hypothetical protein C8Q69DRAFT_89824 [Paecilomyces variotii]|uniref:Uncharacterized protein n=1 Tax=Byssochlamys spectabilis TaxID=264951 RepID=A0A443HLR0_BYSSP|nr:hypothetical protein C8Q69DRAFT_89824 [Paecilomyces variotii]KAJ9349170.1 hypothetical protein DTO280E4_9116 [Paecilomyces variotii]RWQ92745.1 hypothetical protein C8Q69DRAFT_89824 [Paecilomyces variotii]
MPPTTVSTSTRSSKSGQSSKSTHHSVSRYQIPTLEVKQVYQRVKDEDDKKNTTIIAVFRDKAGVERMEEKCQPKWWKLESSAKIIPITSDKLASTIGDVCRIKQRKRISLLVSPYVPEISFHVPSSIRRLIITRCGKKAQCDADKEDHLIISRSSTFCGVMLNRWQDRDEQYDRHEIMFRGGVYLRLDILDTSNGGKNGQGWSLSNKDRTSILRQMEELLGPLQQDDISWWDKWKNIITTIISLMAGISKLTSNLKVGAAGIYVTHFTGIKVFAGAFGASSVVSTAAPVAAIAFGTALAVYFIPWDDLLTWIKRTLFNLWDVIWQAWNWVKEKLQTIASKHIHDDPPPPYTHRPKRVRM